MQVTDAIECIGRKLLGRVPAGREFRAQRFLLDLPMLGVLLSDGELLQLVGLCILANTLAFFRPFLAVALGLWLALCEWGCGFLRGT